MAWVETFCGCISTRKGTVVVATLCLVFAIPATIALSLEVDRIVALSKMSHELRGPPYTSRTDIAITIAKLVLTIWHALNSFVLLLAVKKNMKILHLPWLISHLLMTTTLLVDMGLFIKGKSCPSRNDFYFNSCRLDALAMAIAFSPPLVCQLLDELGWEHLRPNRLGELGPVRNEISSNGGDSFDPVGGAIAFAR
ncbi:unnamed protein product, partial [Darwinula stevensoni]